MTIGRNFQTLDIPRIENDKTTMNDIRKTFGEPNRKGIEDGDLTWTYLYYKLNLLGSKHTRDLYIKFDKNGVVKSFTYNTSFPDEEIKPSH
ncbi:MAG: outer membrane protein assembly factor BamE [Elusimicrobiota bacterium]